MIDTLLTVWFGIVVGAFTVIIILMLIFLAKLVWDYIFDND